MNIVQEELAKFSKFILEFHIPRWEELPDIELYMDQVVTFIEKNIPISSISLNEKIITPSMVNNYVKLNLIPKPIKKKYNKTHVAYLIAISILKHVFTIQDILNGIKLQANIDGEKIAYNTFCEEQEKAFKYLINQISAEGEYSLPKLEINTNNIAIKLSTLSFASKIITEKIIVLQNQFD